MSEHSRNLRQTTLQFNRQSPINKKRKMNTESSPHKPDKMAKPSVVEDVEGIEINDEEEIDSQSSDLNTGRIGEKEMEKKDYDKANDTMKPGDEKTKTGSTKHAGSPIEAETSDLPSSMAIVHKEEHSGTQTSKYFDQKERNEEKVTRKDSEQPISKLLAGSSKDSGSSELPNDKKQTGSSEDYGSSVDPEQGAGAMSPELFDNSQTTDSSQDMVEVEIPITKPSILKRESSWRGTKITDLKTTPNCIGEVKPLTKSMKNHTVLFKVPFQYNNTNPVPPAPYPDHFVDQWDQDHVRMPCSPHNEYPVETKKRKIIRQRWEVIEEALCKYISGPYELEEAILTYNQRYADKWNFTALAYFFTDYIRVEERNKFFDSTLPKMAKLALKMPHLCTQSIPLLKQHKRQKISMSQQQAACLLANAFFCTYPRRNARQKSAEYAKYPEINFNILFQGQPNQRKMEKLKCIVHYFERVTSEMPCGTLTFERKVVETDLTWDKMDTPLCRLNVSSDGTIEDDGKGMLQVDFANKYLGGGVLGHGCVQEEIRFLICPEMILSRLFTEVLDSKESLIMTGCEQFSSYEGYADTFLWNGKIADPTPRDINGRRHVDVVAIDALIIREFRKQFQKWCVLRELNKAFAGFYSKAHGELSAVATGNWGCGAFGGDKRLKALIQLMAASAANRDVCYFTFGDDQLRDDLYNIHNFIAKENGLSVGNLMQIIEQYSQNMCKKWGAPKKNLFEYIVEMFEGNLDSSASEEYSVSSPEGNANTP